MSLGPDLITDHSRRNYRGMMQIRLATLQDLDSVARLEDALFPSLGYPGFFFRQALELCGELFLVAETETGEIVGYGLGAMKYRSTDAWILSIGVRVDCQGSGIGRSLSQELIEKQHALGATTVSLSVAPNNEPAIRLYQLLGFQVSCEIDNYFGPHEPRILMQKHLQAERSC